jgi:hypothetical protein
MKKKVFITSLLFLASSLLAQLPTSRLTVKANIDDFTVSLDGRKMGESKNGLFVIDECQIGSHQLQVENEKYFPSEQTISLTQSSHSVEVTLKPKPGKLSINSNPAELDAYINNEKMGQTPLKQSLPPGDYTIGLRKDSYQLENLISLAPAEEKNVNFDFYARVRFNTNISSVGIKVNGETFQPGREYKLMPGKYTLEHSGPYTENSTIGCTFMPGQAYSENVIAEYRSPYKSKVRELESESRKYSNLMSRINRNVDYLEKTHLFQIKAFGRADLLSVLVYNTLLPLVAYVPFVLPAAIIYEEGLFRDYSATKWAILGTIASIVTTDMYFGSKEFNTYGNYFLALYGGFTIIDISIFSIGSIINFKNDTKYQNLRKQYSRIESELSTYR